MLDGGVAPPFGYAPAVEPSCFACLDAALKIVGMQFVIRVPQVQLGRVRTEISISILR